MNKLYQADSAPRWGVDGFHLDNQASSGDWQSVADQWQQQVSSQPENDLAQYGLAFASLMNGDDSSDLWRTLRVSHPEIAFLTETNARLLAKEGKAQDAVNLLFAVFQYAQGEHHILAARALLSEPFFALLTANQLDSLIATAASDPDTWSNLMEWNHEGELRMRAALLMSAGRWQTAAAWLDRIPEVKLRLVIWLGGPRSTC